MDRMVELVVQPEQAPLRGEEFVTTSPPLSIALDGYVWGSPRFDESGPRLNCNHHEEVDRLATREPARSREQVGSSDAGEAR